MAGTRDGARLSVVLGILKLAPLLAIVAFGVFAIKPANLAWPATPSVGQVGDGALILVLAFIGIETGLGLSGETRDPARTVPRAIALALGVVAALYIALQLTAQGVLGSALAGSTAPLADVAGALFGPRGSGLLLLATCVSVGGYMVADMLSSPRSAYALAETGQLPRWVAWIHPTRHTPVVAIALYATTVVLIAATGSFRQLALLAVAGTLVMYLVVCLGVLRLRAKGVAEAGTPFVAPGRSLVPLAAAAMTVWLLSTLAWRELGAGAAFIAVSAAIFIIRGRKPAS